jgi:hypothetical protein
MKSADDSSPIVRNRTSRRRPFPRVCELTWCDMGNLNGILPDAFQLKPGNALPL